MHCPAAWMHPCRPSLLHCRNKTPFQLFPIRPSRRKKLQSPNPANRTRNWRFPTKAYATISLGHTDVKLKYTLVKPMIQYGGKKQLLHMLHMGISATIVCCLHSFRYEADFCAEDIMLAFFELILLCFIKLLTHFLPGLLSLKGVLNLFDSTYSHTIPLILCNEGLKPTLHTVLIQSDCFSFCSTIAIFLPHLTNVLPSSCILINLFGNVPSEIPEAFALPHIDFPSLHILSALSILVSFHFFLHYFAGFLQPGILILKKKTKNTEHVKLPFLSQKVYFI